MSNSSSSFTKEDENKAESDVSSRPTSEFHGGPNKTASNDHPEQVREIDDERKPDQTTSTASSENPNTNPCLDLLKTSNQGLDIINFDTGNFTTPTSSDHKIPSPKHCPPAPRKPWSIQPPPAHLRKRKGSPSSDIPFRDLDLFFIDQKLQEESANSHKVKKPRTHDDNKD
ncbi:uncharacterized protein LOC124910475 [Impatiens glandulifera]|uniref:uncharacterized protein LOC124910475 n=1 Tax=Impatiens glandulifera TaxID=253017 RepID=UPI001FB15C3A|nr:uncharacterized protein LOC124910475 [Impatiens glandulifera]